MSYTSASHQLRVPPSILDELSPAQNLKYARHFERETGRRNPALPDEPDPLRRRPSLLQRLRVATSRRSSNVPTSTTDTDQSRNRGPSIVTKAKELLTNRRTTTPAPPEQTFRRLPDQLSRGEEAARETEKQRLKIEAETPISNLIVRWKDTNDWLTPSAPWKRTHPAMNYHLWSIIHRNPKNRWRVQATAERNLIDAKLLYEEKGGDGEERWPSNLEEELLDAWALAYGGQDPPFCKWKLEAC